MHTERNAGAIASGVGTKLMSSWMAALAGALVYLPTLWYGFVWDDTYAIVHNPSLGSWHNFGKYIWGPLNPATDMYRPVTAAVLFLEYHLFGSHPWGYHLASLLLHALACAMVFRVALQLADSRPVATFSSLLFAVHATHLEAVAWVSALAEPLMVIATLAGFGFYLNFRAERKGLWLAATCVSLYLGLLSKETAIVLPLLMVAFEITEDGPWPFTTGQSLQVFTSLASTGLLYMTTRQSVFTRVVFNESQLPLATLLFTWPSLLLIYCRHLVLPTSLSPFYDSYYVTSANGNFWLPLLCLGAIGMTIYFVSRRYVCGGLIRFCGIAMAISIVPALDLNIFQFREILHDRFVYLPSVFFALMIGLILFGGRTSRNTEAPAPKGLRPAYVASGAALVLLNAAALLIQSPVWKNDMALFSHAARIAPGNSRPAFSLAMEYLSVGDLQNAELQFEHVVQLVPAPKAFFLLGQTRLLLGQTSAAEEPLRRAIAVATNRPGQHLILGECLQKLGRNREASNEYRAEIAIGPEYRDLASKELAQLLVESSSGSDKTR